MSSFRRPVLVLKLARTIPGLINQANHILASVSAPENAQYFANVHPPVAMLAANVALLIEAQTAARGRAMGAASARDVAATKVKDNLRELGGSVQAIAN